MALLAIGMLCLVLGIAGGLARLGVVAPDLPPATILHHGLVLVGGFFGTVIGLERAVALGRPIGFIAPLAAGAGALLTAFGAPGVGAASLMIASLAFIVVNALIVQRQAAAHALILLFAAAAWLIGNILSGLGQGASLATPWWFVFLVVTIAAERLDLTRFMPRRPRALPLLIAVLALLTIGATLALIHTRAAALLFGLGLISLAAWLFVFDVAAKLTRAQGLARFIAACLLGGYAWLGVAGASWIAIGLAAAPVRDMAIHALALGFIISMIFGHAPIILPAIARIRPNFNAWFYLPLVALHLSLIVRFAGASAGTSAYAAGGVLNAAALALFIAILLLSIRRAPRSPAADSAAHSGG